ncbi:MAG TPA: asparagine synthase (glutamine-hydrolyzing) [Lentisphaeria bacterium]|nr:MAG: asparagine synthase (glutamine-hydrolyzing) [Lentisphaerae bacterium GWF2_50_93]HCE43828.1 asparagine synthase (glutamine-hydrolyzing) [Lentisphaeria bacterium]
MCGIVGIVHLDGSPVNPEILSSMNSAIIHRGPDGDGVWNDGPAGLAHRRLSIIDLAGGKQPLTNEDGTVWITYNGEIYNHAELRRNLENKGHKFKSSCDTEVIVHLYEEYGRDCVTFLNGMFAFGIYDSKNRILLLARDRMGQKPLVYFSDQKRIVFASELQALAKHPQMPRDINLQALHDYFSLQYIPHPDTIYSKVKKLPPAHTLEVNLEFGKTRLNRYWKCRFDKKNDMTYEEAKSLLRQRLEDSVRIRLMSDVPLGAFLSGGIDSTIIVGLMAKISGSPVKTFTIGFSESKYDERKYASVAAAGFKTEHYEKIVNPADFSLVEKLVGHYGEPYCDASMLPTYLLSGFTREKVTVALSGDGADELFAGYYRYLVMKYSQFADFIPLSLRKSMFSILTGILPPKTEERAMTGHIHRILSAAACSSDSRYLDIISRFSEDMKKEVYGEKFKDFSSRKTQEYIQALYLNSNATDPVEKIMDTDINSYLPGDILAKVDIASMACSLELRSPFMDYRIAELAASMPLIYKQDGTERKHILREAFSDLIPPELIRRRKLGFGVPIASWFRKEWAGILKERLLEGKAVKDNFFKKEVLEKYINKHQKSRADYSYSLWAMLVFELWLEKTVESKKY